MLGVDIPEIILIMFYSFIGSFFTSLILFDMNEPDTIKKLTISYFIFFIILFYVVACIKH